DGIPVYDVSSTVNIEHNIASKDSFEDELSNSDEDIIVPFTQENVENSKEEHVQEYSSVAHDDNTTIGIDDKAIYKEHDQLEEMNTTLVTSQSTASKNNASIPIPSVDNVFRDT
ncbi:hypothetical protein L195_g060782, partial [Trifolium pratense]